MALDFSYDGVYASDIGVKVLKITHTVMPNIRDVFQDVPGRPGSYVFAQEYGSRTITIDCLYFSDNFQKLREDLFNISFALHATERKPLTLSDMPGKMYMAKLKSTSELERIGNAGYFTLEFDCEPYALDMNVTTIQKTWTSGYTEYVYYDGSANTPPVISIRATSGLIDHPQIKFDNTLGIVTLQYNATLPNGVQINFDSEHFLAWKGMDVDVMNIGSYNITGESIVPYLSGDFPLMGLGGNYITYQSANGAPALVIIRYRKRWI